MDKKYVLENAATWQYSNIPLWTKDSLGDSEKLESSIEWGAAFAVMKDITHHISDATLRILNTNINLKNYKQDPLYQYMVCLDEEIKNNEKSLDEVNYYHFISGCLHKLANRTLKAEDYLLLWTPGSIVNDAGHMNQEVFERYKVIQSKYKTILADIRFSSIFDNELSTWELEWTFGGKLIEPEKKIRSDGTRLKISDDMWLKQIFEFLETHFDEAHKMFEEGIPSDEIGIRLADTNYKKVLDIKKSLAEYWKGIRPLLCRDTKRLITPQWENIAHGKDLPELIEDFASKKRLFDQKDLFNSFDLTWEDTKLDMTAEENTYVPLMSTDVTQKIVSNWQTYKSLVDFWFGDNNAQAWFVWPSAWYGLGLWDTFHSKEAETSARILMKLMKDNGNERSIPQEKVGGITIKNLLNVRAITCKEGIVKFTESGISIVEKCYNKVRKENVEKYNELWKRFADSHIVLPLEYQYKGENPTKQYPNIDGEVIDTLFWSYVGGNDEHKYEVVDILTPLEEAPILSKQDAQQAFLSRWYNVYKINWFRNRKFAYQNKNLFSLEGKFPVIKKINLVIGKNNIENSEAKHNLWWLTALPTLAEREGKENVYIIFINWANCGEMVMD